MRVENTDRERDAENTVQSGVPFSSGGRGQGGMEAQVQGRQVSRTKMTRSFRGEKRNSGKRVSSPH